MPELPDITVYVERLDALIQGKQLSNVRIISPFILRTAIPPINSIHGLKVDGIDRMGKRIVVKFEQENYLVLHLMIAGRLSWKKAGAKISSKNVLASMDFSEGSLHITEASSRKRASLHLLKGKDKLKELDPGGLEVFKAGIEDFKNAIKRENHTLKRTLTDPKILSGIGNAYSDEILHRAKLSPVLLSQKLAEPEIRSLFNTTTSVLREWTNRLRSEAGEGLPKKVTAFRKEMAVHGRFGLPCPDCGEKIQRIRYASNETNYCPKCQTGGRLLADRALSRLLKKDWPRSAEELELKRLGANI